MEPVPMLDVNRHALRGPYRRLVEHYESDAVFYVSDELSFTRNEAIQNLQCANWVALRKLERLMKRQKIRTARQLFITPPAKLIDTDGVGIVTLFVAMCILDYYEFDVAEWWGWREREKTRQKKTTAEVHAAMRQASA
jgi:hypothetical protein